MAHRRRRPQSARHAGHAGVRLRAHGGGRDPDVPRRQVQCRGSRQPRPPHQPVPDTDYVYAAVHDGADPEMGTVRTAPSGRKPLRFTSFGDQSTPTLENLPDGSYGTDNIGSPAAADTTLAIERLAPAVQPDQRRPVLRQPRRGPGAHVVGLVREQHPFGAVSAVDARGGQSRERTGQRTGRLRRLPDVFHGARLGSQPELRGLWYSFTAGSVRVISLNNDDVAFQDGGNFYVHGYSGGEQKRWLAAELAAARRDPRYRLGGGVHAPDRDLHSRQGQRRRPGHPRGMAAAVRPVRGRSGGVRPRTPLRTVASDCAERWPPTPERRYPSTPATDLIDTTRGTVHLVIGGGGTSAPTQRVVLPRPAVPGDRRGRRLRSRRSGARRRSTCWRTRRGRRFATATTPTASCLSTSTRVRPAAIRRSRRRITR